MPARSIFGRAVSAVLMFADACRASLSPRTREEADIVDCQLSMARQGAQTGMAIFPIAITLISAATLAWFPIWRVAIWPAAMVLIAGASGAYYETLVKRDDHSIASVAKRAKAFCIGSLAQNIAFGSVALILWSPHSSANHVFIFVLLCCALSGWASIGTFHLATGVTSLPVYLVILLLGPVLAGNLIAIGIIVAFWLVMVGLFRTNYITRARMRRPLCLVLSR